IQHRAEEQPDLSIYVVTGGAGFIGSHLATHIGQAGHEVRVLDNLTAAASRTRVETLARVPHVEIFEGDIRDASLCRRVLDGADYVLHHAGESSVPGSIDNSGECVAVNIGGTVTLLEAARAVGSIKRFVFASSCAVYGDTPGSSKHEASQADPLSPYASSKLSGEYFCRNFFRLHGLQTVSLRYFNVYGPDQDPNGAYAAVLPKFMTAIARGEKPVIEGDGEQSRDFIFVDDIVEANLRASAATRGVGGRAFNIGSGQSASLKQVLQTLEQIVGRPLETENRPPRPGDIKHSRADIAAAAGLLQFTPSVSLRDGLARSLHWYQGMG
ncbi:MAG: NAD-dependent epimerase/dehydratase family protein, partial [Armatimonadota bacterium]|nr:NAD-dependent epimerase/dehydratase family protein [Armatimonadota bacterium]